MHSINYTNTLITMAEDCPAATARAPEKPGTVAALQYEMLAAAPYKLTSDDLLVEVEARRKGASDKAALRAALFSKPQACLRASPLVKTYGFGLHHDGQSRVALIPAESPRYAELLADPAVKKRPGMRSARA